VLQVEAGGVPGRGGVSSGFSSEVGSGDAVCVGWAEVHLFLCLSSVSADCLRWHLGKEGIQACGFDEA